jgi:predicted DNA-binding transcriptional regulator AlpA
MQFPKPIALGENSVGYSEAEVDEFLEARAALRKSA